ncbi:MAG: single-stranded DNA-binding protein [Candidatus Omnitrophica bacterium]|nr:single-stranded DNA-binding protein [Candidatus Omnitrophota bacterium]MBU1932980.1 single-stranded DNA-binding protein [Candidatus Omnitrophota bacterium]
MANLNKVFLMGNLTRDPELRYVPSGAPVTTFGLAVNRRFVTQQGEKKDDVCFVRVVVFGKQAESCSQHLNKGRLVFIEGRLQYRSWEQDGQKRNTLDIVADRVQFLGSPRLASEGDTAGDKENFNSHPAEPEFKHEEEAPF